MRGSARIRTPGFLFASPLGETAFAHKCSSPLSLLLSVPGTTRGTQTWALLPCRVHARNALAVFLLVLKAHSQAVAFETRELHLLTHRRKRPPEARALPKLSTSVA